MRRRKLPLRCLWTVQALKARFQSVHQARLYAGDVLLSRLVPVNRGKLKDRRAGCSVSSIYRAKRQLELLCILEVERTKGGCTRDAKGEVVNAATGYAIHPAMAFELAPRIGAGPKLPVRVPESPAERFRKLAADLQLRRLQEMARPGP